MLLFTNDITLLTGYLQSIKAFHRGCNSLSSITKLLTLLLHRDCYCIHLCKEKRPRYANIDGVKSSGFCSHERARLN